MSRWALTCSSLVFTGQGVRSCIVQLQLFGCWHGQAFRCVLVSRDSKCFNTTKLATKSCYVYQWQYQYAHQVQWFRSHHIPISMWDSAFPFVSCFWSQYIYLFIYLICLLSVEFFSQFYLYNGSCESLKISVSKTDWWSMIGVKS